ncbi:hypothetical protein TNCV_2943091 [Trichonephila clavipes]|nr:hypothetical protein TNCV_2943091 [Trichonephila clavipes]
MDANTRYFSNRNNQTSWKMFQLNFAAVSSSPHKEDSNYFRREISLDVEELFAIPSALVVRMGRDMSGIFQSARQSILPHCSCFIAGGCSFKKAYTRSKRPSRKSNSKFLSCSAIECLQETPNKQEDEKRFQGENRIREEKSFHHFETSYVSNVHF